VPFGFLDLTNGKIFLLSRLRSAFGCGLSQSRKIVDGDLPLFFVFSRLLILQFDGSCMYNASHQYAALGCSALDVAVVAAAAVVFVGVEVS